MAPQKRRRDAGVVEIETESGSSSLRQEGQRKKVRLSEENSRSSRGESVSSESDDEPIPDADDAGNEPAMTQYEQQRDGNWEHLADEAHDDRVAAQRFLTRKEQIGENHAAENSIIEEITCINFMCHSKLHVVLGPLINFVVGMNGSGKSAVLTAITLCLAGKPALTDRGSAMKNFVKSGETHGLLIIKLKNQGQDAYQPEIFGKTIIVERHFTNTGSGGWRLKSGDNNRTISTKKTDIEDIVEYFQLQVDNPMTVLTQDKAKTFLTKSTPKDKYDFFVEGVQLRTLDSDYKLVSETCDSLDVKLVDWEQGTKVLRKKAEAARAKADMVEKHEGTRREARRIRNQFAWSQVEALEEKLKAREALVLEAQEEIQRRQEIANNKDEVFQGTEERLRQAQDAETSVREKVEPLNEELANAKAAHDAATKDLSQHKIQGRNIVIAMKQSNEKVTSVKATIQLEEQRLEDINGGSHARMKAAVGEAKNAATDAKAAWTESQQQLPRFQERSHSLYEAARKAENDIKTKRKDVEEARQRLEDLNNNREDVMAGFDSKMGLLLDAIRKDGGFREKPVGPMGLHIRLLKPQWAGIIEKTIGANLNGFVVTSKPDQLRLSGLVRHIGIRTNVPILIGNNNPIDISGNEPDPRFDTILRVLDIDSDLVRRQLIIAHKIEQTILIEHLLDAEIAMYEGARPGFVFQCLVINKDKRGWGWRLSHAGRGGQDRDLTPISPFGGKSRMKTTFELEIQERRATFNQCREIVTRSEPELRKAQQEANNAKKALKTHETQIAGLKIDSQRADQKMEDLQVELDREVVEDGRLDTLRDDLREALEAVAIDEEAYGNSGLEKERLNKVSAEKKIALDDVRAKIAKLESVVNKAATKTRNIEEGRNMLLREKNTAIDAIEHARHAKQAAEAKRDRQAEDVDKITAMASEVSPRVPIDLGQTTASLEAKFKKLKQQLDMYARQQGASDEEIQDAAVESQLACEHAESNLADIKELHLLLKQAFVKRIGMYRSFQKFISARSRINFSYLLSERAFRGKLSIDHKAKKLDVHVEPDETTKSAKGRQTKTLSGGEKSFSNICLLLSLWEAMGQPLRCLDEFDVFMDDVNRDVSTGMIISAARRSVGRQFILITPKGLGNGIDAGNDVKMIKLKDPRDKSQRGIDDMINGTGD